MTQRIYAKIHAVNPTQQQQEAWSFLLREINTQRKSIKKKMSDGYDSEA